MTVFSNAFSYALLISFLLGWRIAIVHGQNNKQADEQFLTVARQLVGSGAAAAAVALSVAVTLLVTGISAADAALACGIIGLWGGIRCVQRPELYVRRADTVDTLPLLLAVLTMSVVTVGMVWTLLCIALAVVGVSYAVAIVRRLPSA